MGLVNSGAISFGTAAGSGNNRSIYQELGIAVTSTRSLGASDMRNLADEPSGTIAMSDFHGKSAFTLTGSEAIGSWPVVAGSITHPNQWGTKNFTNSSFAEVIATIDFLVDETNNRIEIRYFTSDSNAGSSYTTVYLTYVDLDISQSSVWQCKADWNYSTSVGAGAAAATITEPASNLDNAYRTLSTGSRVVYTWKVTANSGNETGTIGGLGAGPITFYLKNTDGGGTAREVNSGTKNLFLKATRGTLGGGGGPR